MNLTRKSLKEIIEEKRKLAEERKLAGSSTLFISTIQPNTSSTNKIEKELPINPTTPTKGRLLDLLKKRSLIITPNTLTPQGTIQETTDDTTTPTNKETFSLSIILNKEQELAKELAFAGKSFCIVGAAGTGKTTAQREIAKALLQSGKLSRHEFRIQGTGERTFSHSIAFIAYTRVASGNLRRAIHKDSNLERELTYNVTTVHNLLEYSPEVYFDPVDNREKFRFIPRRTGRNPLDITHLVIEESSMLGLELWNQLYDAMRCGVQIIFIGDINQLPPVFGDSILNYALVQLPVVELTQVYRQAGDSGILENAHRILKGESVIERDDFRILRCGTENHSSSKLSLALGKSLFPKWKEKGEYDPIQDIILSPWNVKDLGTEKLNKWIAQSLGEEREAIVFELIAGIAKLYLAIGDKVMVNKQVGVITKIARNGKYLGTPPKRESSKLTRFGDYSASTKGEEHEELEILDKNSTEFNLDEEIPDSDNPMKMRESSHVVDILLDDGYEITLSKTGDFSQSNFSLAYALTVHKAQGCEWRKVFFILHRDHSISLSRELFYTGITRAREKLILIAKDEVIDKAIKNQRIKGNTIKEKIEYFNSGISLNNSVRIIK